MRRQLAKRMGNDQEFAMCAHIRIWLLSCKLTSPSLQLMSGLMAWRFMSVPSIAFCLYGWLQLAMGSYRG